MADVRYIYREVVPFMAMVTVECSNMVMNTLYKAAVSKGLNYHVFMASSYVISALILLPVACIFHRNTALPPFDMILIGKFFVLGFLGFLGQYFGYRGIAYSNPTLGSAMSNIIPAFTFFLAVLLRMERLNLRKISSQAKIIGTVVSVAGALVTVLYRGPVLISASSSTLSNELTATPSRSNWILGGAYLTASYIVTAVWYIFQAYFVNEYPAEFILIFAYNFFAGVVAIPVCFIEEPNRSAWKVPADVRLLSIVYSGIMGTAFGVLVHIWGAHVKGPVYVALFRPLSIAITAIAGVIFLHDNLYLGSVIGSIIIAMGFYTMVWGKMKEEMVELSAHSAEPSNASIAPLLKMEKVVLSSTSSSAKIIGTIVSISGAFIVTFYKGPCIKCASAEVLVNQSLRSPRSDWMVGSMFLAVEYTLVPVWYIIQTHIMKLYPAELTIVFFYTLFVSALGAIVGFFAETDSSKWTVSPRVALASILCSGVFGNNAIHTWALHLRGPVYVAMFKPLSIAIAASMGAVILGDNLYLGSIIGAAIIVIGFYTVMWGKAKEDWVVELDEISDLETAMPEKHPLLQNHRNQLSQGK